MVKNNKIYILLHPLFILFLLILIINDHYLKILFPSYLVGKLSDFAGLFVFVIFFSSIISIWKQNKRVVLFVHISTLLFFSFVKIYPIAEWFPKNILNFCPDIKNDSTDLIALVILPASYYFFTVWKSKPYTLIKKLGLMVIIPITLFSIIATSQPVYNYLVKLKNPFEIILVEGIDDPTFEKFLDKKNYHLVKKEIINSKTSYRFESAFKLNTDSSFYKYYDSIEFNTTANYFFIKKDSLLYIDKIEAYSYSDSLDENKLEYFLLKKFKSDLDSLIHK